jgi:hypothetical protein
VSPTGKAGCPPLKETEQCGVDPCPQHCRVSSWVPLDHFGGCSVTCGGGTQSRSRQVLVPSIYGGRPCPVLQETRRCKPDPCPVNCVLSPWSEWSRCTVECNGGVHHRFRTVLTAPKFTGLACPMPLEERRACNVGPCASCTYAADAEPMEFKCPIGTKIAFKMVAYGLPLGKCQPKSLPLLLSYFKPPTPGAMSGNALRNLPDRVMSSSDPATDVGELVAPCADACAANPDCRGFNVIRDGSGLRCSYKAAVSGQLGAENEGYVDTAVSDASFYEVHEPIAQCETASVRRAQRLVCLAGGEVWGGCTVRVRQ